MTVPFDGAERALLLKKDYFASCQRGGALATFLVLTGFVIGYLIFVGTWGLLSYQGSWPRYFEDA